MKKKMIIGLSLILLSCGLFVGKDVFAYEKGLKIPERMQPNSRIEYISQNQYKIICGGKVSSDKYNQNGLTEEEQSFADANIAWAEGLDLSEIDFHHNPNPELGMVVKYDDFGFIEEIQNSKMPYTSKYNPLPSGTTSSIGNHVWGSFNNTLSVTTAQVRGGGRMTYFSDVKGEKDNPAYNTQIYVTVQEPNSSRYTTQTMYKRDNGNLENAILDIWKTGVEYFGYYYDLDRNESNFDPKDAVYFYNR